MDLNNEKLELRKLGQEDLAVFTLLVHLFNEVFEEDEPAVGSETSLSRILKNNNFVAMAAFYEGEIVGGLTAYELPMYYSENSEIFIYDLAVKPEYQRMGVGKSLIYKLKEYCVENGIVEFFVLAHEEDEHALEFYRSTGGKSEDVVNFLYKVTNVKE